MFFSLLHNYIYLTKAFNVFLMSSICSVESCKEKYMTVCVQTFDWQFM